MLQPLIQTPAITALPQPYLLFLGDVTDPTYAKTAFGLRDWALGLLHGSQPDVIVVCHEPGRRHMLGLEGLELPTLEETIDLNLKLGRRTNPSIRCAGISFNTAHLPGTEARRLITEEGARLRVPIADPMRGGPEFERLVDSCLS